MIGRIRNRFLKEAEANASLYHKNDVQHIRTHDWPIERFALVSKDENETFKALKRNMLWRNKFGINEFNNNSFSSNLLQLKEMTLYGEDKEKLPILWFFG